MKKYFLVLFVFLLLVPSIAQADLFFGIGFGYHPNYPVYRQHYPHYHNYNYSPRIINNHYYPKSYHDDNYRYIPQQHGPQQHIPQQHGPIIINNYYR